MRRNLLPLIVPCSFFLLAPLCSDDLGLMLEGTEAGLTEGEGLESNNNQDDDDQIEEDLDDSGLIDEEPAEDEESGFHAVIQGSVYVQMYTLDDDGEYIYVSWEDAYDGQYIFGSNFVTAYTVDEETGTEDYYAQKVIASPSIDGDEYELVVQTDSSDYVRIYAANDYWADRIIGNDDPIGNYPDDIFDPDPDDDYNVITGVDVHILIPYWDGAYGGGGFGWGDSYGNGYGYGGGDYSDCTGTESDPDGIHTFGGDILITSSYAGGDAVAMILDEAGSGPYGSYWVTPETDGGGASAEYTFTGCSSTDYWQLVGAHDSNYNGIADPSGDKWGVYISEAGVNGNPVVFDGPDRDDMDIQIPLDFDGLDLTPFVRISGTVTSTAELDAGSQVYVGALKYRPSSDIYVSDLADGYDYEAFNASEVAAGGPWPYDIVVPANTITYLWAYADVDNDGRINEAGEPVGSAGEDENGRFPTGEISQVYDFDMSIVD